MKQRFNLNKLRNKIWLYFIIFTVVLVCFIWLLQTVFFEYNYQSVRGQTVNLYADLISNDIKDDKPINEGHLNFLQDSSIGVWHFKTVDNVTKQVFPIDKPLSESAILQVEKLFNQLENKNLTSQTGEGLYIGFSPSLYTVRVIRKSTGNEFILLTSSLSLMQDTVKVLRNQLIFVAVIVTAVSLFISYVIADRIARPIDDMSAVAERWAKGDETVLFKGSYYAETEELANALNKAKDEVNKSGKLQKDLLANVSHDLKTPLTMIKAYAEMIKDISGDNKEKREKHTQVIIEEADRLTLLVNDILNLSKLQSQSDVIEKTTINLSKLIETVIYRFSTVLSEKGYVIEKHIEQNVFVCVDEKKIEEVIYNLIGNSINYTGEDKTVKIYLTVSDKTATLEILDSGLGISGDKIETIWEKYYRFSETHKRTVKGTGLGLSIVKTILDYHNLNYGVISKVNTGSNFYIVFERLLDKDGGGNE